MISLLLALSLGAHGSTLKSFAKNRQGIKHLQDKMGEAAHRDFLRALEDDPLNPAIQLNLGITYEANEEFEKAAQVYRGVQHLTPPGTPTHYQATFNLAGALGRTKKIDEALAAYQECLKETPDSVEVKTNIELLLKGGGGGGEGKDGKGEKDGKDKGKSKGDQKDEKDDKRTNQQKREQGAQEPEPKPQPKPFDSKDMKPGDVKRILDEIKNQEQSIRANEYERNAKDAPLGKDW